MKATIIIALGSSLGLLACSADHAEENKATSPVAANVMAEAAPAAQSSGVVPRPADQAQLDRMITAGYTPHGEHMHPPGVKECPISKGNEAVM